MITTTEMAPHPELADFVQCYTFREFNTMGIEVVRPWHAIHQISVPFFFRAVPVKLTEPVSRKILKTGKATGVVGLCGQYNGDMSFNGDYAFFEILFRPTGFQKIFDIPSRCIIDHIFWGEEILQKDHSLLHEQMFDATTPGQVVELVNCWLLKKAARHRRTQHCDRITYCSNRITKARGLISLDYLAKEVNMSARTFERHFIDEVGVSPKHLCCIARFNQALEIKLARPEVDWTAIAQYSGYYDQMHLIRDFKRFAGSAPMSLLRNKPMMQVEYAHRAD